MSFKKTYVPKEGYTQLCKIGESSFTMLEFGIIELPANETLMFETGDMETAFVILSGKCSMEFDNERWENIGSRKSVFDGKAHTVYMPRRKKVCISTPWKLKIAVIQSPIGEDTKPELITPDMVTHMTLGKPTWLRDTDFLINERVNSKRLFVGEAFINPGNWAGFPPHKHDKLNMPTEGIIEEVFYYQFHPEQGFALLRSYTEDGEFDETYTMKNNDLVELPRGYHTTVGAPGYNTYFLWAMVGEHRGFFRVNDPEHEWVSALENYLKKNGLCK